MIRDLLLNDLFYTLQGEGFNAGRRALFIRLPYCNLSCSWCDTQFNSYKKWSEGDFIAAITKEKNRFAVITGGEPTMNKQLRRIIELLRDQLFEIAIETNGHFPVPRGIDFITCSPKREYVIPYYVHPETWDRVREFKYVVDEGFDWDILRRHDVIDGKLYLLSPEWGRFKKSVDEIVDFIKENPKWKLSLQTHKFLGLP